MHGLDFGIQEDISLGARQLEQRLGLLAHHFAIPETCFHPVQALIGGRVPVRFGIPRILSP